MESRPFQFSLGRLLLVLTWCSILAALLPFGPWRPLGIVFLISGMAISVVALVTRRWFPYIIGALAIALLVCVAMEVFTPVMVGQGRAELLLAIHVSDADAATSIPNARIVIYDPDIRSHRKLIIDKRSDANGQALVILPLRSNFRESFFRHSEGASGVSWFTMEVSADGYGTLTIPMKDVVGRQLTLPVSGQQVNRFWNAPLRSSESR